MSGISEWKEKFKFSFNQSQWTIWDCGYLSMWVMLSGLRLFDVSWYLLKSKNYIWKVDVSPEEYRSLLISTTFITALFFVDIFYSWVNIKKHSTFNRASKLRDGMLVGVAFLILLCWMIIYLKLYPISVVILFLFPSMIGVLLFFLKYKSISNNIVIKAQINKYPK